jgi:hypothetical protein
MEDAQHHEPIAIVAILEDVRSTQHLHHDLPVLFTRRERPTELRMRESSCALAMISSATIVAS